MDPPTPPVLEDTAPSTSTSPVLEDGFEYLSEPNENLICPICRNPFLDPVMCESTDHVFCRTCLIRSLETSATCPIDRLPLSLSLVAPAPKIIMKLVDELLVACPFKSKSGCSFVCQRDLMSAHVRSHQSQHYHPRSASETSTHAHTLAHHLTSRPSSRLRFQWMSGRATLVEEPSSQAPISDGQHKQSDITVTTPNSCSTSLTIEPSDDSSQLLSHCPFEQFGCQFIGTSEMIKHEHLSAVPLPNHSVTSPDPSRCQFSFVQDILKSFQNLERRNTELKQQLSQSLVKQDELTSSIQSLKASFRQLLLSRQPTITDQPSTPFSPQASAFVKSPHPPSICTNICPSIPESSTSPRRSSDGSLPIYSSRLNYDTSNGNRLKHFNHHPPSHPCQCQHFSSPPSSSASSTFRRNIRVSTFVRKGEIVTPTAHVHPTVMPINAPTTHVHPTVMQINAPTTPVGFDQPFYNSLGLSRDPCSRSQLSANEHSLINPKIVQMIHTIHEHLDDHHDSMQQQHDDSKTRSTNHPTKILDTLKDIKKLLCDLVDRGNEDESEAKNVHLRTQEETSSSSSSNSSSSSEHSPHVNVTGFTDHLNTPPTDRRNSSHLKL